MFKMQLTKEETKQLYDALVSAKTMEEWKERLPNELWRGTSLVRALKLQIENSGVIFSDSFNPPPMGGGIYPEYDPNWESADDTGEQGGIYWFAVSHALHDKSEPVFLKVDKNKLDKSKITSGPSDYPVYTEPLPANILEIYKPDGTRV